MNHDQHAQTDPVGEQEGRHGGHHLMMIACCIPMLVIAVALVAAGVVSAGFLRGMSGGDKSGGHAHH